MHRDGEKVIVYLGEDRQLYFHRPGKVLCQFPGRIMHHGDVKYVFLTEIPENFDGGKVMPPPNYKVQGIPHDS